MGLEAEKKNLKSGMIAGIHLAIIYGIKRYLDQQKNPIINDGEMGIVITFANGKNEHHEQIYWIGKGNDGKEKYFTKMCIDAGIDMSKTPLDKKDAIGKRLWIAIREVYTLVNDEVKKDITGTDIIEHFIFNTFPCFDPEKIPFIKGDPNKNMGQATDDFISYKNEGQSGYDVDVVDLNSFVLEVEEANEEEDIIDYVAAKRELLDKEIAEPLPNFDGTIKEPIVDFTPHITKEDMTVKPDFKVITNTELPNFSDDVSPDINFK